jgi:hypothetical protein
VLSMVEQVEPPASVTVDQMSQTSWSSRTRLPQCSYSEQTHFSFSFIPLSSSSWWTSIPIRLSGFFKHTASCKMGFSD